MYFGEMNYITRAIPLFKETRGRHVTVLQNTSDHDPSRPQWINICSVLSRNYRVAQNAPVSYLTVKCVFMSDPSTRARSQRYFRIYRADQRLIFFEEDLLHLSILGLGDQPLGKHPAHHAHRGLVHFLALKLFLRHGQSPRTATDGFVRALLQPPNRSAM